MSDNKALSTAQPPLDDDIIELLATSLPPVPPPAETTARMRNDILQRIHQESAATAEGFSIVRANDSEWIEAYPGASYKPLQEHGDGLLSYLIRLEPGFRMQGHGHPFDEECLMIEGDLTLGDITLHAGDFHLARAGVMHGDISTREGCIAFIRGALPI
jgi:quercetin dioxygenase-like cupin family protein